MLGLQFAALLLHYKLSESYPELFRNVKACAGVECMNDLNKYLQTGSPLSDDVRVHINIP